MMEQLLVALAVVSFLCLFLGFAAYFDALAMRRQARYHAECAAASLDALHRDRYRFWNEPGVDATRTFR